jgi:tetraacyldisaccharide 4'-kinase
MQWGATGGTADAEAVRGVRVVAVSGIADNTRFAGDLREAGVSVSSVLGFNDHHRYTPEDISRILNAVRETSSTAVATTTKDLARLSEGPGRKLLDAVPVLVLPVEVRWVEGERMFLKAVEEAVSMKGRR